jgi:argininosuccinate synthase
MLIHPSIHSFADISRIDPSTPVVTLFSGGLDSAYLLLKLREAGFTQVVALSADLGDPCDEALLEQTASQLGATLMVRDLRADFAEEFVAPAIPAQAVYLGIHPVSSTLSRPLLAREAVRVAEQVGARAIVHTANQSQNSLRRLNGAIASLGFTGHFGTPYETDAESRAHKQMALEAAGLAQFVKRSVSGDANLWCREFESGLLDDPENFEVPPELYEWSVATGDEAPETLTVRFAQGRPVALDDEPMNLVALIGELNRRVGRHGLGRYAGLEHIDSGEKVLEIREMPAAFLLFNAYKQLEAAVATGETIRAKLAIEQTWVREALEGRWFGNLRRASQAFIMAVAAQVTGEVSYRLDRYGATVTGIRANDPLYIRDRDKWETNAANRGPRALTTLG